MPTGHRGTITFGTTGASLSVISITPPKVAVGVLELPHLSLTEGDNMPCEPLELVAAGQYTLMLADDNNTQIVHKNQSGSGATFKKIIALVQTITWTKPPAAGLTNGATRAFSGFVVSAGEAEQQTGQRNTYEVIIQVAGNYTLGAGS
jgi:hypothetical protein